jgi:UDP-N-acetylmuramoyl-tripeptide--D-alanyl-D-alanine ligase
MAVIEMGANHIGEIASYCVIAEPTHGLITNIGKAHLEGFGGEAGVRKGKGELFDHLRATKGTAFVFKDQKVLTEMSEGITDIFGYGSISGEVTGQPTGKGHFLEVAMTKGMEGTVATHLVGSYNLPNVLAAVAVGSYFNVPETEMRKALESYEPTNSRSQLLDRGSNKIILDAYNANPSSMKAAIQNFSRTEAAGKVLALGAMAELGTESVEEHKQIISEIDSHKWDHVLLVGGDFMKVHHSYHSFSSPAEAGKWLKEQSLHNSWLLIKGSRSMQMEKLLDYL